MTTRPILFSGAMVRAILDGTKSQTRRIVKPQPESGCKIGTYTTLDSIEWITVDGDGPVDAPNITCPYGQPGDRMWVRETWAWYGDITDHEVVLWRADAEYTLEERGGQPWRPSIHMPRWASRITLEITGVRVERLQAITEADAKAEGIERIHAGCHSAWKNYLFKGDPKKGQEITDKEHRIVGYKSPIASYQSLWNSINGPGSWDANPLVWVIEFKRSEDTK